MSLQLKAVTVKYPAQSFEFNLDIPTHQKVAIIGESGSGKSTLLNTVAGFIIPNSGKIIYNGKDITKIAPGERGVSLVFQDNNHFPHLSILDNVKLAFLNSKISKEEAKERSLEALERLNIKELADKLPMQCSGGQLQRASLARAFLFSDDLLMLDEPFSALDADNRILLGQELKKLTDKTLIIITHNMEDVTPFVDRVIKISQGTIVDDYLLSENK